MIDCLLKYCAFKINVTVLDTNGNGFIFNKQDISSISDKVFDDSLLASVTARFPFGKFNFLHRPSHFLSGKHDFLQGNSISYLYYSISHIAYSIFYLGNAVSLLDSFVSYMAKANTHLFIQIKHIIHLFESTLCLRKRMLNKSAKPK